MRIVEASTRSGGKRAGQDRVRSVRTALGWPDVLYAVQNDEARSAALGLYRARGFRPDDFGRIRRAREAMADALTRTEDMLEMRGRRSDDERARVRAVRRQLEWELWP